MFCPLSCPHPHPDLPPRPRLFTLTSALCLVPHQSGRLRPGWIHFSTREASESPSPERGHLLGSGLQLISLISVKEAQATPAASCLHLDMAWEPAGLRGYSLVQSGGVLGPPVFISGLIFVLSSWDDFPEELRPSGLNWACAQGGRGSPI